MPRICIDVRNIKPFRTGVGRYAENLAKGIAQLDVDNEYILLTNPTVEERIIDQPNFIEVPMAGDISSVRNAITGSRTINALKPDIYHALSHYLPFGVSCPRLIITLHDLMWIETPRLSHPNVVKAGYNKVIKGWFEKSAVHRADVVLSVSEATRERAIEVFNMPPKKCKVIYHGVSNEFKDESKRYPTPGIVDVVRKNRRYIFSLGHSKPYKNVHGTIRAFKHVAEKYDDLMLIVVGRGEGYHELRKLTEKLGLNDKVSFFSSLSDADVVYLLKNAACFSFPSFVEGFGLPIIEAMAAGCPVVTSNVSAPREIAGDAALLVDPHDESQIATGFNQLLDNDSLRRTLIKRGLDRATDFSVEKCVRETLKLYADTWVVA